MSRNIKSILTVILLSFLMTSCNQAVKIDEDHGYLVLSVDKDPFMHTRAVEELGGDQKVIISIYKP